MQAPAPSRPIERGIAGPDQLAHVLVARFADHLSLYRQSVIYAREGVDLDCALLASWVGAASDLLRPLVEAIRKHVLVATKLHAIDMPVLAPGNGKLTFRNGDRYEGMVAAGVRQGVGSMQFASGDRYEGEFSADVPHGLGNYRWASGDRYEGQWQANLRHGQGTFTWNSGDRWSGIFKDGAQTDEGVLTRHTDTPAGVDGQRTADAS